MTLWTKISNLLMNIKVNLIQFSGKCGQKHEIMDKNMKLWTKISSLLMNI
jgi:hypothetical protein